VDKIRVLLVCGSYSQFRTSQFSDVSGNFALSKQTCRNAIPPSRSMMSQIQPRLLLCTSNPTNKIQMFPQLSIILVLLFRHFRASAWTTRFSAVFTTKLFDVCCAAEQVIFMAKMYDIPVTAVSLCSRFCQRAYAFLYSFCYNFVSLNLVSF